MYGKLLKHKTKMEILDTARHVAIQCNSAKWDKGAAKRKKRGRERERQVQLPATAQN
jgi:hypothetical protein